MAKETIDVLVEGGKATAAPPLGPALGPLGVNIGQVIAEINNKTGEFKGMRVPVKVVVDRDTKKFEVSVGTPPASALIIKEAGIEKGSGNPLADKVADLKIEQIIKISKMKSGSLLGKDPVSKVREIIGTCNSMGVMVEGKPAKEALKDLDRFRDKIMSGKTELTAEELKALAEEKKRLQEEMVRRREEFLSKGKAILAGMQGKTKSEIKAAMVEAGIPTEIINELMPEEKKEEKPGEKPKA
jgi:large subunit ribosomal protein L11